VNATDRANIILGLVGLGLNGVLLLVGAAALVRDWCTNRLSRARLAEMAEAAKRHVAAERVRWQAAADRGEAWTRRQP
jgi:hypothetical protein